MCPSLTVLVVYQFMKRDASLLLFSCSRGFYVPPAHLILHLLRRVHELAATIVILQDPPRCFLLLNSSPAFCINPVGRMADGLLTHEASVTPHCFLPLSCEGNLPSTSGRNSDSRISSLHAPLEGWKDLSSYKTPI
jgi:hypothetical protein